MPKIHLTQQFVDNSPIAKNKTKVDYFNIGRSQAEG
jgi:hypothetical protein